MTEYMDEYLGTYDVIELNDFGFNHQMHHFDEADITYDLLSSNIEYEWDETEFYLD